MTHRTMPHHATPVVSSKHHMRAVCACGVCILPQPQPILCVLSLCAATRPRSTTYNKVVSDNTVFDCSVYVVPGLWGQTASTQGVLWVPR